jgi:hypothetical protein
MPTRIMLIEDRLNTERIEGENCDALCSICWALVFMRFACLYKVIDYSELSRGCKYILGHLLQRRNVWREIVVPADMQFLLFADIAGTSSAPLPLSLVGVLDYFRQRLYLD